MPSVRSRVGTLTVFTHLKVVAEVDGVGNDVVGPGGEVHVANGALRKDQASKHLGQVVCGDTVAEAGVEQSALAEY
jgi:hypothetical protein